MTCPPHNVGTLTSLNGTTERLEGLGKQASVVDGNASAPDSWLLFLHNRP